MAAGTYTPYPTDVAVVDCKLKHGAFLGSANSIVIF
jgi:hypothetical protein